MSSYWASLAWLGGPGLEAGVAIEVDGERIVAVRTGVASPPPGYDRLDGLVLPGLANAHSHAFQRALRGRTQRVRGSFWTWREQMYALAARLDPDAVLTLARATFGEMALAGVTLVGEFHYLHHAPGGKPYAEPNAIGAAVLEAAAQAGVRITLLDACYLHGGIGVGPDQVQRRFCDADVDAWAARVDGLAGRSQARQHLDLAGALDVGLTSIPQGSHLGLHLVQRQEPLIGGALCPLLVSLHQGGHGVVLSEYRGRGCPQHPKPRWRAARRARGSDLQATGGRFDERASLWLRYSL